MGPFVLVVEFTLYPGTVERFMPLITANARESLESEPGCQRFDVVQSLDDANRILLYEIYDDVPAFDAHREMPHVKNFFQQADELIADRKFMRFEGRFVGAMSAT
jgi:quinol monooxygenase YgiN